MMGAVPAFAEDSCPVPPTPAVVDGATASREQLVAGIGAVKTYIAASDTYQACIADYIKVQTAAAAKDKKPLDPALIQTEGDKVTANQTSKQTRSMFRSAPTRRPIRVKDRSYRIGKAA